MKYFRYVLVACTAVILLGLLGCAGGGAVSTPGATTASSIQITTTQLPSGRIGTSYVAPLTVSGGTSPTQWSVEAGSLPSGLAMSSKTGAISGTPGDAGNFEFTAMVTDSAGSSAKTNLNINVTSSTNGTSPTSTSSYYGSGFGADSLANTALGPNGNTVSYRFRAKNSGVLAQSRIYLIPDHPGYAAGTGGKIEVDLKNDDGSTLHNPGPTVLASTVISNVLSLLSPARYFYVLKFASPPTLTAGQLYHMVFKNMDDSPKANFLSVDALGQKDASVSGQNSVSNIDAAVLLSQNGGAWAERKSYVPIYELDFQNGVSEGIGYIEAWVAVPQPISGLNTVRESFTVSGSELKVKSVSIRLARIAGNDPLKVRLENADGSLIEQGNVSASALALSSSASPAYDWVTYPFSTTYTLMPGQTYHLVFEATSTTTYQAFPIRKGSAYGFKDSTFFSDGHAEFMAGNSWVGWTQWGAANRIDGDLQFYFAVIQ